MPAGGVCVPARGRSRRRRRSPPASWEGSDADRLGAFAAKLHSAPRRAPGRLRLPQPAHVERGRAIDEAVRSRSRGVGAAWVRSLADRGDRCGVGDDLAGAREDYSSPRSSVFLPFGRSQSVGIGKRSGWRVSGRASAWRRGLRGGRRRGWTTCRRQWGGGYQLDALRKPNDRALTRLQRIRYPAIGTTPADVVEIDERPTSATTPDGQGPRRRRLRERQYRRDEADRLQYEWVTLMGQAGATRIRATLFAAIAADGYAAPTRSPWYLLGQDDPDRALLRGRSSASGSRTMTTWTRSSPRWRRRLLAVPQHPVADAVDQGAGGAR